MSRPAGDPHSSPAVSVSGVSEGLEAAKDGLDLAEGTEDGLADGHAEDAFLVDAVQGHHGADQAPELDHSLAARGDDGVAGPEGAGLGGALLGQLEGGLGGAPVGEGPSVIWMTDGR